MKLLWNISFTNKLLILLFWVLATPLLFAVGLDVLIVLFEYSEDFPTWVFATVVAGVTLWVKVDKLKITKEVITREVK